MAKLDELTHQFDNPEKYKVKSIISSIVIGLTLATSVYSPPSAANDVITCESRHKAYTTCPIQSHGYVRLKRQISRADCIQGRTWDYDQREIWVDDNCKAQFEVETRRHTKKDSNHTGEKALAAAAAIAIIAAVASSSGKDNDSNKNSYNSRYDDDNYYGSRHSSYIPRWMVGDFEGYNTSYDAEVSMYINENGRVSVTADGTTVSGYINNERMHISNYVFYVNKERNGLRTTQVGDESNQVHYRRVR